MDPQYPKVLLALTGSVATILYKKIVEALNQAGYHVDIIVTEAAKHFTDLSGIPQCKVFSDADEWKFSKETWAKGEPVLHINLADEYSALVIAPCSANTLAKLANGICDNLLTSVARAWPWYKPLIIAPAMNTRMWDHSTTNPHLHTFQLSSANARIVTPQSKMLACGYRGMGAMAEIYNIVGMLDMMLKWHSPLGQDTTLVVPVAPHPGAFASERHGHFHTGLDLYTEDGHPVFAMEDGEVVSIENFTGPSDNSPWWEDTKCVMIRGASGVINYGEITPQPGLRVGQVIWMGNPIGQVKRVIRKGREHPEITGWSPSMLHLELYKWEATRASNGFEKDILRDPTPLILKSFPKAKQVTWSGTL
jgi:hypothetical protein